MLPVPLFALVLVVSAFPFVQTGADVLNPYPALNSPAFFYPMEFPIDQQIQNGALVFLFTVEEALPSFEIEGSPDWLGGEELCEEKGISHIPGIPYYPYRIRIEKSLFGNVPTGEAKLMIGGAVADSAPQMKPGDRFIVTATLKEEEGYYYPAACDQSFFYVSEDNRVYPGCRSKSFLRYTGMTIGMFEREIAR